MLRPVIGLLATLGILGILFLSSPRLIASSNPSRVYLPLVRGPYRPLASSAPWPMYQHDPRHSGRSPYIGAAKGILAWTYAVPVGTGFTETTSPVVGRDGTVYVGTDDGFVYAVSPDGILQWTFQTREYGHGIISLALGPDGTIYAASVGIYALNSDGTLQWYRDLRDTTPPGFAAIVEFLTVGPDGTIYFNYNISSDYVVTPGYFAALDPSGTLRWWVTLPTTTSWSAPAIGPDGTIYTTTCQASGWIYALNPNGTVKWRAGGAGDCHNSVSVAADGTIYSIVGPSLHAINSDGSMKWNYNLPSQVEGTSSIAADGTIYVLAPGSLIAIAPSGAPMWQMKTGGTVDNFMDDPSIGADGTIYLADTAGTLAVSPRGAIIWRNPTAVSEYTTPAIGADGTVYVNGFMSGPYSPLIYAFR